MKNTFKKTLRFMFVALTLAAALALASCAGKFLPNKSDSDDCDHEWLDATCEEPKTCENCGETKGKPLGHDYDIVEINEFGTHTLVCANDENHTVTEECFGGVASCASGAICEACQQVYTEPGENHKYTAVAGNEPGTHTLVCEYDKSHTVTESCSGGAATCDSGAICIACSQVYTEPVDHDYEIVAGDKFGTHMLVCKNNKSHVVTENCYGGEENCLSAAICKACSKEYTEIGEHEWADATCTKPTHCIRCEITDGEPNGHDYDQTTGECKVCDEKVDVILYTNTPTLVNNGGSYAVTFYAYVNIGSAPSSVKLYSTNGVCIGNMYDDGDYPNTKDEFSNDGVYTCHINVNSSSDISLEYYVKVNEDNNITCNQMGIEWIDKITSEDLDNMEQVDQTLNDAIYEDGFEDMTLEEKAESVQEKLDTLVENNLIVSSSIVFKAETATITFVYDSGALGAIVLEDFTPDEIELVMPELENTDNALSGDAVILWSFDQAWDNDDFRSPYYDTLSEYWNEHGLNTTLDKNVTVEDYKNLEDYEMIVISAYGAYYEYKVGALKTQSIPGIILSESATRDKDELYTEDLQLHRIAKITINGETKYAILPEFWSHYYANGGLDGSFVVSESGEFFGVDGSEDYSMADAIRSAAAEGVLGFKNAPMSSYSRNFMFVYVTAMLYGQSADEAFALAKEVCGENDYFEGRDAYGPTAYPIYSGNNEYILSLTLENGSFENSIPLLGWSEEGDIRVINKLGALSPTHGDKMAILTTGVGSGTSDYTGATEGSVLSQTFIVGENDSLLSFDYDVVSEEPMEYVGSQYDDKMYVQIIDEQGNSVQLAYASINTSTWYSVTGIDFEGGDQTAYHTGWSNVEFDISEYRGQLITIRFIVYDVGDSAYDTAALIDNVLIKASAN